MVGDDLDSLPASVQQFSCPPSDAVNLFVEVVDHTDTVVVPSVIDLAGFRPGMSGGVTGLNRVEDLYPIALHERPG